MKTFKFLLISFVLVFLLISCTSNEEMADELIRAEFHKTLFDFASYDPIETKIDSLYLSVYSDSIILEDALQLKLNVDESTKYLEKAKDNLSTMDIYSGGYFSRQYNEASREFDENMSIAQTYLNKAAEYQGLILKRSKEIKSTFMGWQINHTFRCKSAGGIFSITKSLFYTDENFKKVLYYTNIEDFDRIKGLIDEVLKSKESNTSDESTKNS